MGTVIVLAALALVVLLAIRSVIETRKSGSCCNGDCGSCKGCH